MDDGSSDGSSELARRAAEADPQRVRYLEHPQHANRGMSASRNLGCVQARGGYVTFLDADDVLRPEALETLLSTLRTAPRAAMAYGPVEYWYSWAGSKAARGDFVHERHGQAKSSQVNALEVMSTTIAGFDPDVLIFRGAEISQLRRALFTAVNADDAAERPGIQA